MLHKRICVPISLIFCTENFVFHMSIEYSSIHIVFFVTDVVIVVFVVGVFIVFWCNQSIINDRNNPNSTHLLVGQKFAFYIRNATRNSIHIRKIWKKTFHYISICQHTCWWSGRSNTQNIIRINMTILRVFSRKAQALSFFFSCWAIASGNSPIIYHSEINSILKLHFIGVPSPYNLSPYCVCRWY